MNKRLTKGSEPILGGVVSGFAEYFEVDPMAFRLLFVALTFFSIFFAFAYLICWLVMPNYQGETTPAYDQKKTGLLFIILGILLLLRNFFPQVTLTMILAIGLIGAGLYFILKDRF